LTRLPAQAPEGHPQRPLGQPPLGLEPGAGVVGGQAQAVGGGRPVEVGLLPDGRIGVDVSQQWPDCGEPLPLTPNYRRRSVADRSGAFCRQRRSRRQCRPFSPCGPHPLGTDAPGRKPPGGRSLVRAKLAVPRRRRGGARCACCWSLPCCSRPPLDVAGHHPAPAPRRAALPFRGRPALSTRPATGAPATRPTAPSTRPPRPDVESGPLVEPVLEEGQPAAQLWVGGRKAAAERLVSRCGCRQVGPGPWEGRPLPRPAWWHANSSHGKQSHQ
jgi:hypothetical protein